MKEIVTRNFLMLHKVIEQHTPKDDTLLTGRLGLSLYYHALYEAFGEYENGEKAGALLEEVFANLSKSDMQLYGNAFGGGGAGLGYIVNLFSKTGLVEVDADDDLDVLDSYLYKTALEQITQHDRNDFLHGATGTIHYFTQRADEEKIRGYLENLVTALCNKAVTTSRGTWIKNWVTERKENTEINLSLSHGLCSFLIILVNAWQAGIRADCIKETVTQGVNFILSYQMDIDIPRKKWSLFPSTVNATNLSDYFPSSRLAWCYGDLGPILLLYKAAAIVDNADWVDKANLFGTFTIMRNDPESTAATETLFCHGTAGIAEFYNTLYRLSGIEKYQAARTFWLEKTISMLPGEMEKALYHGKECDFLEGLVGVNLALLSYISDKPLGWAKSLLLE